MLRFGKISDIDPAKGYARVTFTDDGIVSDWLQIVVMGALSTKFFHMFDINEQVACLMDDNSEEGVILGAVYNDNTPPSGGTKDKVRVLFSDESFIEYDRSSHEYNVNIQGVVNITANQVNLEADTVDVTATTVSVQADTVSIEGETAIEGDLVVSGSITGATVIGVTSISSPSISGGGVTMTGGNMSAPGDITGATVKAGVIDLATHTHSGVQPGSGSTGPPS